MIELSAPESGASSPVVLERRTVRGRVDGVPARLDDRIFLGEPATVLLTPDAVSTDAELHTFVSAEASHTSYWLVQFTCTFEHEDDLPFATAWVQLVLTVTGGPAIAHSMEPAKLMSDRTVSWSAKLAVPCVLLQPEATVGGEVKKSEVFCEASREGSVEPAWKYYRTSQQIRGLQRMRLVVRTPSCGDLSATIRVGATASHARFGRRSLVYDRPSRPWLHVSTV